MIKNLIILFYRIKKNTLGYTQRKDALLHQLGCELISLSNVSRASSWYFFGDDEEDQEGSHRLLFGWDAFLLSWSQEVVATGRFRKKQEVAKG